MGLKGLKKWTSLLFFPVLLKSLVLMMDVPTPAVPLGWLDTAVPPAQCPVPTSAVVQPVIHQQPPVLLVRMVLEYLIL